MAGRKEHLKDCKLLLGDGYNHVHGFLDQYVHMFPIFYFDAYHRTFLHNKYGLEMVKALWGLEAEKAAMVHLVRDFICIQPRTWKMVEDNINKALICLQNMDNYAFNIRPDIVRSWKGRGLVAVATEEERHE